jgi:hypothetical protein
MDGALLLLIYSLIATVQMYGSFHAFMAVNTVIYRESLAYPTIANNPRFAICTGRGLFVFKRFQKERVYPHYKK